MPVIPFPDASSLLPILRPASIIGSDDLLTYDSLGQVAAENLNSSERKGRSGASTQVGVPLTTPPSLGPTSSPASADSLRSKSPATAPSQHIRRADQEHVSQDLGLGLRMYGTKEIEQRRQPRLIVPLAPPWPPCRCATKSLILRCPPFSLDPLELEGCTAGSEEGSNEPKVVTTIGELAGECETLAPIELIRVGNHPSGSGPTTAREDLDTARDPRDYIDLSFLDGDEPMWKHDTSASDMNTAIGSEAGSPRSSGVLYSTSSSCLSPTIMSDMTPSLQPMPCSPPISEECASSDDKSRPHILVLKPSSSPPVSHCERSATSIMASHESGRFFPLWTSPKSNKIWGPCVADAESWMLSSVTPQ